MAVVLIATILGTATFSVTLAAIISGSDAVYGFKNAEKLYGDSGDDFLYGGGVNDYLQDSAGYDVDYIYGGSGADEIRCKGYQCNIFGEAGDDRIYIEPQDIENAAWGGSGNDYIEGIGHGVLYGNDGNDTLKNGLDQYGGAGADHFICDPKGFTSILDYNPLEGDSIQNSEVCLEVLSAI